MCISEDGREILIKDIEQLIEALRERPAVRDTPCREDPIGPSRTHHFGSRWHYISRI
jgi:hypothetical protein